MTAFENPFSLPTIRAMVEGDRPRVRTQTHPEGRSQEHMKTHREEGHLQGKGSGFRGVTLTDTLSQTSRLKNSEKINTNAQTTQSVSQCIVGRGRETRRSSVTRWLPVVKRRS